MHNRIKEIRQQKNISQSKLASELGATQQAISFYETGKREPKLETWQKLADFFDVSVPYLQGISNIKELNIDSTFEEFFNNLEQTDSGDLKVPYKEFKALSNGLQVTEFFKITNSILNNQNDQLSQVDIKEYKEIISKLDSKDLAGMDEINLYMTTLYLIMLNAVFKGEKKEKKALKKIEKIMLDYLGIEDSEEEVVYQIIKDNSSKNN